MAATQTTPNSTIIEYIDAKIAAPSTPPPKTLSRSANNVLLWLHGLLSDAAAREKAPASTPQYRLVDFAKRSIGRFYSAVPEEMRNNIKISDGHVFTRTVKSRKVALTIIFAYSAAEAAEMARQMFIWLDVADTFAPNKCARSLSVFVILSDFKKELPSGRAHKEIRESHVNSGLTVSCAPEGDIYVYRREEWFKVFIHETIHSLGIDFSAMSDANLASINACIKAIFPINKPDIRIFEAYCEAWAEIIHAVFYVLETEPTASPKAAQSAINRQMARERYWSAFQCAKIMRFYGITYDHLISKNKAVERDALYKESDTYTFSYYAAKMILLCNLGEFLDWCTASNENVVGFRHDLSSGKAFCELLRDLRAAPEMLALVKSCEINARSHIPDTVSNTLRMAATEIL